MKKLTRIRLKPRNPFVTACLLRVAGAHRASGGARRQSERHDTRKLLRDEDDARRHEKHL
ncbi:MAG: hypothetical protein ABIN96_06105 [Rubrivivax sp.]